MCVPKGTGADIEFGNSIIGPGAGFNRITSWEACSYMLEEAPGWRSCRSGAGAGRYSFEGTWFGYSAGPSFAYGQANRGYEEEACLRPAYAASQFRDYGRSWFIYCLYGDMGHTEGCLPIALSCYDHVAALHGLYNIVAQMRRRALAKLPEGQDLFVTINNTDGSVQTSYGAHFNVLVKRSLFNAIFHRKPHVLGGLASALAALTPLFGQGHILCRNGRKPVFTLSQRAHHIGVLVSPSTTTAFRRPLINARDESHGGPDIARLHLINFDASLQQYTVLFRVWFVQALLAAMEAGYCDTRLMLEDPIRALKVWARGFDPGCGRITPVCPRVDGGQVSLVEMLEGYTEGIEKAYSSGKFDETIVPNYKRVLPKWKLLLKALRDGDVTACAEHLDWALKYMLIDREMHQTGCDFDAPEIRMLDQLYSHVDREVGLYWSFEKSGFAKRCVSEKQVARMQAEGPTDTRAYTRKRILETYGDHVSAVDWGEIRVRVPNGIGNFTTEKRIRMDDPLGFNKAQTGPLLDAARSLEEVCDGLDGEPVSKAALLPPSNRCRIEGVSRAVLTPSTEAQLKKRCNPVWQHPDGSCLETGKKEPTKEDVDHE